MALLDKDGRKILYGAGLGLGFAVALPGLRLIFKDAGRPLAKASLLSGFLAYEKSREVLAEWRETLEDLMAEVQADVRARHKITAETAASTANTNEGGAS